MGLAMSRSFGDAIVHTMGVSADPEVTEHHVDTNDIFLILATDGIWDVIDSQQSVQIVHSHYSRSTTAGRSAWNPTEAAHLLAMTARRRWESLSPMIGLCVGARRTGGGLSWLTTCRTPGPHFRRHHGHRCRPQGGRSRLAKR